MGKGVGYEKGRCQHPNRPWYSTGTSLKYLCFFRFEMLVEIRVGDERIIYFLRFLCLERLIASCLRTHKVQYRIKTPQFVVQITKIGLFWLILKVETTCHFKWTTQLINHKNEEYGLIHYHGKGSNSDKINEYATSSHG